ncbi:MAG: lipopolysaccharide heptosyltransferase II [Desulfococcaceae bacterium]
MNILIVKLSAIGDVIHTLPALNALRRHYPKARITWLIEEAAASLVHGHNALDRLIVSRRKQWVRGLIKGPSRMENLRAICAFIRTLRDTHYDLIFDFQQLLKSGIPVWLAKGKRKFGFDRGMEHMEHSHIFLNERIPPVSMEIHALRRYLMLIQAAGVPVREIRYGIPVRESDRNSVEELLIQHGAGKGRMLVGINPVAQWKTKLWQNEKFAALADRLAEDYYADVVFTGGPDDITAVNKIRSRMKSASVSLAGKTSLTQLAALYEKTDFVISTDTGPMHLAAAVGTPVTALFGPTAPWRTGPFGSGHEIIRTGVKCSPCFKRHCARGDCICMNGIQVEDVLSAVRRLRNKAE